MIAALWDLLPILLGIVASPLAIMALIATLLSPRARENGVMFLVGWSAAVAVALSIAVLLFDGVSVAGGRDAPTWMSAVRLILGAVLAAGSVWTYRRARVSMREMARATTPEQVAAAAPQLPGWLSAVADFTPFRTLLLGLGIFLLNPINVSCAFAAVLDIRAAALTAPAPVVVLVVFAVLSIVPTAVPVAIVILKGERAAPQLHRLRSWLATNNGLIGAGLLAIVAFSQIQKAIQAWM